MKTCYIVGAGDFSSQFTPESEDFVIAADGGYSHLLKSQIRCDLFVGDADSLGYLPNDVKTVVHPQKKDQTDMHLAYLEGRKRGYKNFVIYGGTGGRVDHTFANFSLLLNARKLGDTVELRDTEWGATVICNEKIRLTANRGEHLSVFAFGGSAQGVSLRGTLYEAENITLTPDFPLGVSNAFTDKTAEISVNEGALLIIFSHSAKTIF